jgi:probable F420-dependent oxidoreductase
MHIGLTMFATDYAIAPHVLAQEAEARGFESIWLPEHTHIPANRKTPYPAGGELPKEYSHTLDPFGSLCAAAVVTKTIKLATGICLLIERDTIVTAKEAATVDLLSNGRFIFGVGGGWNVEEMANHGTDFKTRFRKLKEQVAAVRVLWAQEEAEFHGQHVNFDKLWCHPKPVQQPGPPIVLGGLSTQTMERAIDYGDGWIPIHVGRDLSTMRTILGDLDRRLADKGRTRTSLPISVYGAPQRAEAIAEYRDLGVERIIFLIRSESREQVLPKLDRLAALLPR